MAVEQATATDPMEAFYRDLEGKDMDALWRRRQTDPGRRAPAPRTSRAYTKHGGYQEVVASYEAVRG